jgi:hypothetical protein
MQQIPYSYSNICTVSSNQILSSYPVPSPTYQHLSPHFLLKICYNASTPPALANPKGPSPTMFSDYNAHAYAFVCYAVCATSWTVSVSILGREKIFIASVRSRPVFGAQISSFAVGNKVLSRTLNGREAMISCNIHLAQWLRVSGAIPLLPLYDFIMWTGKTSV